jgi:hypothetical protein
MAPGRGGAPMKAAERAENRIFQRSDFKQNAGKGVSRKVQ